MMRDNRWIKKAGSSLSSQIATVTAESCLNNHDLLSNVGFKF